MPVIKHILDMETAKVFAAASVPFLVWGKALELGLSISIEAIVFLYVCLKFYRFWRQPERITGRSARLNDEGKWELE